MPKTKWALPRGRKPELEKKLDRAMKLLELIAWQGRSNLIQDIDQYLSDNIDSKKEGASQESNGQGG